MWINSKTPMKQKNPTKQNKIKNEKQKNSHKSNLKQTIKQITLYGYNGPDWFWEVFKQVCWQGHCTQMEIIVKQNWIATHLLDLVRRDFKGHFWDLFSDAVIFLNVNKLQGLTTEDYVHCNFFTLLLLTVLYSKYLFLR